MTTAGLAGNQVLRQGHAGRGWVMGRLGAALTFLGGLMLASAGAWVWHRDAARPEPGAQLRFEPAARELGSVRAGELRVVAFRAINRDDARPARVLGIEQKCTRQGCIFWQGTATTIPPGGSATFEVQWKGMNPGRLVQEVPVFTDCPGQVIVRLTIAGDVVPADETPSP